MVTLIMIPLIMIMIVMILSMKIPLTQTLLWWWLKQWITINIHCHPYHNIKLQKLPMSGESFKHDYLKITINMKRMTFRLTQKLPMSGESMEEVNTELDKLDSVLEVFIILMFIVITDIKIFITMIRGIIKKKTGKKRSGWPLGGGSPPSSLTASILWKFWPILSIIKWQNNPKYDVLSRNFYIFLTASGEGGGGGQPKRSA